MNKRVTARKTAAVLLLLAMILGLTVALPVGVSAEDPAEITDFSYQSLAGATHDDDSTDLRFLFKIDSLEYEKVGFVFSKSDATPTIGETGCGVYETTSVYGSIEAAGEPQAAGENQWWVTVKLAGIPKASFGATVYVVGFVKAEGEDPVYTEARRLSVCEALGHDFSMAVSENVATYTCVDCGYSFSTNVNTSQFEETPSLGKFSIQDSTPTITKELYDSNGDSTNDCVRTTMTNTGKKYWLNYTNANPTYADGKTNVISFKTDIRIATGSTPSGGNDLFLFYYAFSGNAGGTADQGYGFRFRDEEGDIVMRAFGKESGTPTYDVALKYDTWYSVRCDVTVATSGSTHTIQSIKMYVNDHLVHTVDLANLNYSSYSTNKVRMMIIGISGATVTYDIRNVGVFVGAVQ
ncbi:MAG: hypothetical protein J6Z13_00300 [Clostridia bacterium]|nr:hypothetical protein [Clostridia bacterium]